MRSISSASPPAVGKTITGRPKCPQRATVTSLSTRLEYQRSRLFMAAKSRASVRSGASPRIDQARFPGKEPAETFEQPVAPVDPVVAVERLHHPELVAHSLQHFGHRPIRHRKRLEGSVGQKDAIGDLLGMGAHRVDETDDRLDRK